MYITLWCHLIKNVRNWLLHFFLPPQGFLYELDKVSYCEFLNSHLNLKENLRLVYARDSPLFLPVFLSIWSYYSKRPLVLNCYWCKLSTSSMLTCCLHFHSTNSISTTPETCHTVVTTLLLLFSLLYINYFQSLLLFHCFFNAVKLPSVNLNTSCIQWVRKVFRPL